MIEYLKGKVVEVIESKIVLEVNNVGYAIFIPSRIVREIKEGEEYKFYIYEHIYENGFDLYGFLDKKDREIFALLTNVSNVGPKIALKILSFLTAEQLVSCISLEDKKTISSIKGVGEKVSERIINELKRDILKLGIKTEIGKSNFEEIIMALRGLGFNQNEIIRAINNAKRETPNLFSLDTSEAIQICLKQIKSS